MASFDGDLVVGGMFTSIGGVSALHVARRNHVTGQWSAMGSGFNTGAVYALAVHNGTLYAGGTFLASGGDGVPYLARWTGTSWTPSNGIPDAPVFALASFGNTLHVGGDFLRLSTTTSPFWAKDSTCAVVRVEPRAPGSGLQLGASVPNPGWGAMRIPFSIGVPGQLRLMIYDVAGRRVRALVDGWTEGGESAAIWDGRDENGLSSPPGTYFCRLQKDGVTVSNRIVLLRASP
jgi:hypothetical protein